MNNMSYLFSIALISVYYLSIFKRFRVGLIHDWSNLNKYHLSKKANLVLVLRNHSLLFQIAATRKSCSNNAPNSQWEHFEVSRPYVLVQNTKLDVKSLTYTIFLCKRDRLEFHSNYLIKITGIDQLITDYGFSIKRKDIRK